MATDASRRITVSIGRWVAFQALSALFRLLRSVFRRPAKSVDSHRVLVVEPYGMGDVLALEPTLTALGAAGWNCDMLTRAPWAPLLPAGTNLVATTPVPWNQTSLRNLLRQAWQLRRSLNPTPAVGLDPRGDIRTLLLLAIIGCPRCLTFDHYVGFNVPIRLPGTETAPDEFSSTPKWRLNLKLAELLIGSPVPHHPPAFSNHGMTTVITDPRRVGLIPLAPWDGKLWPAAFWAELIRELRAVDLDPVVLCGPGESRRALEAVGGSDAPCVENADIPAYAECLRRCSIVVTLDTGPMHLASAVGCAVVALFGSGQLPLWQPAATRAVVLTSPEMRNGPAIHPVPENTPIALAGMASIAPNKVLAAVQSLMSSLP